MTSILNQSDNFNVVLIVKSLEGRGAERSVSTLASGFLQLGWHVHIVMLENTIEIPIDEGINLHVISYNALKYKLKLNRATRYKALAKDIDHYILTNVGVPNLVLANLYKINWIMSYSRLPNVVNILHTALSKQFEKKIHSSPRKALEHLKEVYSKHPCSSVSEGARLDLIDTIGNIIPTVTIFNPCNSEKIISESYEFFDFKKLSIEPKQFIIHVGSFDIVKNHELLIRAFAKTDMRLPLVLVGKGKLEEKIKRLVNELGIEDKVKFAGFIKNPYPLIANASLMVLTSNFEGFGYVIAEGQILKVPVISTDCPYGPRELLPKANLTPINDSDAMTCKLIEAIQEPQKFNTQLPYNLEPVNIANRHIEFIKHINKT